MAAKIRPDWWAKTSAGAILGFGLGLSLAGLFVYLAIGNPAATPAGHYGLLRHMVAFIWILVFGLCFLFRSGSTAWLWLGVANLVSFAALFACRFWFFA
ncbi:hypothetical protein CAL29_24315 [Bordetella genomosp. 10]|uniref:Uncharacterized protein n=1 Tax=Bordetella genomosp. 10 TaxID=1416804 RepID=A0A261S163_9BORD|nr:hypothetical protein [Bordetella genomosp. 10]OZI31066.1 hypothetical protein CAL29_24315 [Bordetella genomosp. 10]